MALNGLLIPPPHQQKYPFLSPKMFYPLHGALKRLNLLPTGDQKYERHPKAQLTQRNSQQVVRNMKG